MAEKVKKPADLEPMRHTLAHTLAAAVQLLWPKTKFGVGPVVEDGFYYDIDPGVTISDEDLGKIEAKMRQLIEEDHRLERFDLKIYEAIKRYEAEKQPYKVELLKDLKTHGTTSVKEISTTDIGVDKSVEKVTTVSFYRLGKFEDLCRGPHLESTGQAGAFKLLRVSGAYWRGNEKNPQLQRIYGAAFVTDQELANHLKMLEEAEKRDHRKLGKQLDLFVFSDLVGSGLPLYTPRGTVIIEELKNALKDISRMHGMEQVSIPHLAKLDIYKLSGHADKFSDELFTVKSHYNQEFILKPVNCPHHTQIYASRPRSYRELPLRYIEQTMQYRDEKPGQIGGLQRTRGFTVDDGHTFCRVDQIETEVEVIVKIITEFYKNLGLWGEHWVSLSVREPSTPDAYIGEPNDWDQAEKMLAKVADKHKLSAVRMEGEAALYGPKLDFMFKDALGRQTQLATIQLDFAMPQRFGLTYTDQKGADVTPVMIHRAILGSFERFMMLLIEHYAGKFPLWLSPEQVRLATVNDTKSLAEFAKKLKDQMMTSGLRVTIDESNESVGRKIREAEMMKVPYTLVIGDKEASSGKLIPRIRTGHGSEEPKPISIGQFITTLVTEHHSRASKSSL